MMAHDRASRSRGTVGAHSSMNVMGVPRHPGFGACLRDRASLFARGLE